MDTGLPHRRLDRRALIRGGLLGGAALATAALIGCGGSSEEEDDLASNLAVLRSQRGAATGDQPGAADAHDAPAGAGHAAAAPAAHGDEPPHWTYEGIGGPDEWGELGADYAACSVGRTQSPINIESTTGVESSTATISYHESALTVVNDGHTIQANVPPGSEIAVDGKAFGLLQFHFHAPSEHTIEGHHSPLEMHLVHRNNEGNLAVVGVFFEEGAASEPLAPVWDVMPHDTEGHGIVEHFDIEALLPPTRQMYRYSGSLTTPPCSEGVRWMLMQTPVRVSGDQVEAFSALIGSNNRPLQPLWAREVLQERPGAIASKSSRRHKPELPPTDV